MTLSPSTADDVTHGAKHVSNVTIIIRMRVGCSRRQGLLITLFSLLLTSTCVVGDDTPCVVRDNGRIYDLNPLKSK